MDVRIKHVLHRYTTGIAVCCKCMTKNAKSIQQKQQQKTQAEKKTAHTQTEQRKKCHFN